MSTFPGIKFLFKSGPGGGGGFESTRSRLPSGKLWQSLVLVDPRLTKGLKLNNMRGITLRDITWSQHVRGSVVRRHCAPDDFQT